MTDRALLNEAALAKANSYSPYSGFPVGAAIECEDGSVFRGCNVENASYGMTNCAEASAITAAICAGRRDFKRIAICSDGQNYTFPCGKCRQMLYEFAPNIELLCARADGRYVSYPLSALLPMAFGPEHLD